MWLRVDRYVAIALVAGSSMIVGACMALRSPDDKCPNPARALYEMTELPSVAPGRSVSFKGVLTDLESGTALPDGAIWIHPIDPEDEPLLVARPDTLGRYSFSTTPGRFGLSARFIGYTTAWTDTLSFFSGTNWRVDFQLQCQRSH